MEYSLAGQDGRTYRIQTREVSEHDPELIKTVVDIDLMTWSEQTFSRYTAALMLRHGRTFLLVADDVPVGTCQAIRSWERPTEAVLFSISIRPGWRGRGLGTRFLEDVFSALERSGVRSVVLSVDVKNDHGLRIYESRFGFTRVGLLENEYGKKTDEIMLRKVLNPALGEVVPL